MIGSHSSIAAVFPFAVDAIKDENRTTATADGIGRGYRDGGTFQWVRETAINAIEAGAKRIEFGVEWQGVKSKGVYRRTITDDGKGMTPSELEQFFNEFGGGGKQIGDEHENYGIGSKTSLLPWNRFGVVVVSWVDGEATMIRIRFDEKTQEYGLEVFDAEDERGEPVQEAVIEPYDDPELGIDWRAVKPSWIDKHGTVIVLLGQSGTDDTVLNDLNRPE